MMGAMVRGQCEDAIKFRLKMNLFVVLCAVSDAGTDNISTDPLTVDPESNKRVPPSHAHFFLSTAQRLETLSIYKWN
jgi:hypothetical protein